MHKTFEEFIVWASSYDDGDLTIQSRRKHEMWLNELRCPVVRLDAELPTALQIDVVLGSI